MSDHNTTLENLDTYLADGLSSAERADVDQHCATCPECSSQLSEARHIDKLMQHLFADARPDTGLEDRMIQKLRRAPRSRPSILRFVGAAAAVLVVGLLGFVLQAIASGDLPQFGSDKAVAQSQNNLRAWGLRTKESPRGFNPDEEVAHKQPPSGGGRPNGEAGKIITELADQIKLGKDSKRLDGFISGLTGNGTLTPSLSFDLKAFDESRKELQGLAREMGETHMSKRKIQEAGYDQKEAEKAVSRLYREQQEKIVKDLDQMIDQEKGLRGREKGDPKPGDDKPGEAKRVSDKDKDNEKGKVALYYVPIPEKANKAPGYFQPEPKGEKADEGRGNPKGSEVAKGPTSKPQGDAIQKLQDAKTEPPPPPEEQPPEQAGRKIIRTGEMEFEVDSFYGAVDTIENLLATLTNKKGFVATTNSDKLPNGKMRGSVVVRMPPEHLDRFLKSLREALAKTGELKSQRIGSQDVTKQYTDIESELRAARAVETRLIEIIKTGKGEIKDLVAAERELGTWRTKIEKMEGEIRYSNNQISLSTVTILLNEKELQVASALVLRERVNMRIEVEDVDQAQDSVTAGVKAAKGRVVKLDGRRAEAGQVNASLTVDVPPASARLFRELLRKLGTVTRDQAERTQQAEGGTGRLTEIKEREEDVRFDIDLYNTANIKPRETLHLKLGSKDVPTSYLALRKKIEQLKGQIRTGNLNEQDKLDINAELAFNVGSADRAAIDELLAKMDFVVSRYTVHAAVTEVSTDRKIGYDLKLRSASAIAPKESFRYEITSQNVPMAYGLLIKEAETLKGRIHRSHLDDQDKYLVRAELDVDLGITDKAAFEETMKAAGAVALRRMEPTPPNVDATDKKVGYRLVLRSVNSIQPRDTFTIQLAAQEVPASYRKLLDEVLKRKGRVLKNQLDEQDKYNITAALDFEIEFKDREPIDKLLGAPDVVVSRTMAQAGPNQESTDLRVGFKVSFINVAGAKPRETATIVVKVPDVDDKAASLKASVQKSGGRVINSRADRTERGDVISEIIFEVPHKDLDALVSQFKAAGTVQRFKKDLNPASPDNALATAHIQLFLTSVGDIVPSDQDLWSQVRTGLYWAFFVLSKALVFIITGLAGVVPVVLVLWGAYRLVGWMASSGRGTPAPAAATGPVAVRPDSAEPPAKG